MKSKENKENNKIISSLARRNTYTMNTMCFSRNDVSTHILEPYGPKIPVRGNMNIFISKEPPNCPMKILYKQQFRCIICGDGGLFDQDGNAIEYYQATTVYT
jgi:hypothetical protein